MGTVFAFLAFELLDRYVADLIKAGKFDKAALEYIDLERSNDLLGNIDLAENKRAVIESAFVACPFNLAVYMYAMKLEMLDGDTFETANVFGQGAKIISSLEESLGAAHYPAFSEPNYHSASLLARYTNRDVNDVLYQHTASYADIVIEEYKKVVKALGSSELCRNHLNGLGKRKLLSGEGVSKQLANSIVYSIVPNETWDILVNQCGHTDLFERLIDLMPAGANFGSKADCDSYLAKTLFDSIETVRKDVARNISAQREHRKEERRKAEKERKRKRIKAIVIFCLIAVSIVLVVTLPTIVEITKKAIRESAIETRIQETADALEQKIESQIDDDVTVSSSYEGSATDRHLRWSFEIGMSKFKEFREAGGQDEALLLEIMNNCEIIESIVKDEEDSLDFVIEVDGKTIYIDYYNSGTVTYSDLSTNEIFSYYERDGKRCLHSYYTEYALEELV